MSDLVGNPEDRFSHNEAHLFRVLGIAPESRAGAGLRAVEDVLKQPLKARLIKFL